MIHFDRIEFKNFLSYGNTVSTYNFEKGITRIRGENGAGKSSCVVDTLYFALFGKTYRKTKLEHLVNSVNKKNLEVKLYFTIGEDKYLIVRGLKPNKFKIYKNDVIVECPSTNRSYQAILEEDILHMSSDVFDQTVIKSLTKNLSFLSLKRNEKRQVVESILGIEIFSDMNRAAKHAFNDLTIAVNNLQRDISYGESAIEQEVENLAKLRSLQKQVSSKLKKMREETEKKIDEFKERLSQYSIGLEKIKKYEGQKETVLDEKTAENKEMARLKKLRQEIEADILVAQNKIKMFQEMCPTCPKIKTIAADEDVDGKTTELKILEEEITLQSHKINLLVSKINQFDKIINNKKFINSSIAECQREIAHLQASLERKEEEEIKVDETKLKQLKSDLKKKQKEYNQEAKVRKHMNVLRSLISDEAFKAFIIKRYLPHINKILNTYLQKFNADILFYFDTEFNEVIGSRYKEGFNYHCFSEGQKRRIDLSILFTFLEFCKIRNRQSETNILILDEITAGVDGPGENMLYDILRDIVNREGKEVITVSHSLSIDADKIDKVYDVTTDHGFSKINVAEG